MSDDSHNEIVEEIKAARDKRKNGIPLSAKDYRRLNRFDVICIGDHEKLINATEESNSEIKYYCRVGEMFDIIELGHKKEKAIYHSGIKRTPYEALFGIPQKNGLLDSCLPSDITGNIDTEEQLEEYLSNLTHNFDETDTENVDEANT
ncbi:hypothetical protein PR048_019283 [Dryococelus australis]|uniref:Uncharacterized protein n=1 Tax=Dryococelus australis TaxID=614101 RepID=A0ABQ9H333_9NEOP|nr:hypothetical protein PR048_019283 [Dryococelus australis]